MLDMVCQFFRDIFFFVGYVGESGSFPEPLSQKEEREMLLRLREGDGAARTKLIEHNLRLVAHVAKKYAAPRRDQDDLISIGTVGLIKAVSTFDLEKNSSLATYAARCIENATLTPRTFSEQKRYSGAATAFMLFNLPFGDLYDVFRTEEKQNTAGIQKLPFLFPAALFYRIDYCIQKLQLLLRGAVQCFQPPNNRCGMDICHPHFQLFFSCFCFRIIYDQIDRSHASDRCHLPGHYAGKNLR